ncbi:hypothetical protein ACE1CD_30860 [Aerosakkonema sp. BLCC-F183]
MPFLRLPPNGIFLRVEAIAFTAIDEGPDPRLLEEVGDLEPTYV